MSKLYSDVDNVSTSCILNIIVCNLTDSLCVGRLDWMVIYVTCNFGKTSFIWGW